MMSNRNTTEERDLQQVSAAPPSPESEGPSGCGGEYVCDFDLMREKKKLERRKKTSNIDVLNGIDDAVAKMIANMRSAAREDRELNRQKKPATKKISMLRVVMTQLNKPNPQMFFLEANGLSVLTDWLAPMPDKSLPSNEIRSRILKLLKDIPINDVSLLKEAGIGKAVMYLYKHPRELTRNKRLAGRIVSKWSRLIFNVSTDYSTFPIEERILRDEQMATKRSKEPENDEQGSPLRPGDPGICYRARVPQLQPNAYVHRPEWTSQEDISGQNKAKISKLDRQMRAVMEEKRRKRKRTVNVSI